MPKTHTYDYKLLFDNKTVGIIIVNQDGVLIEANDFASRMFGYSTSDMTNGLMRIDNLVPKNLSDRHSRNRKAYNKNPHMKIMGQGIDLKAQRKDGSIFPVEVSLSPYESDGQSFTIAFINDITIRKNGELKIKKQNQELEQVKKQLEKLNQELEEKVVQRTHTLLETMTELESSRNELKEALKQERELGELKSRFVSMASHEFRTPLSTILSSAELIKKYIESEKTEHCERHINRIKSSVEHLNNVLEDFLSIGRIEEGQVKVNVEKFSLTTEIENTVAEIQELTQRNQTIHFFKDKTIEVYSDKHLFKIALSNILSNAIKFSKDGGKIEVHLHRKNNFISVQVKDYGIGIPKSEHKRLFYRFFRASNSSGVQGTGLGTYIAKKYINILGGEVTFESAENTGTTFYINLPL